MENSSQSGPTRTIEPSHEVWRFLVSDLQVRLTALIVIVLAFVHILIQLGLPVPWRNIILTPSVVLIAFALVAAVGPCPPSERGLWRRLQIAYGLWLSLEVFVRLSGTQASSNTMTILVDCGYVTFFTLVLLAVEQHNGATSGYGSRGIRLANQAGIIVLVVGLLAYFLLIPNRYDSSPGGLYMPSYLLYTIFDFVVGTRLVHIASRSTSTRWRFFGVMSGLAFVSWGLVDLIDAVAPYLNVQIPRGSLLDLLWFIPFVLIVAAHRLRTFPLVHPPTSVPLGPPHSDTSRGFPIVPTLALSLIAAHVVGYGFGILGESSRGPREILIVLMLLVVLISVTSRRAIGESEALAKRLSRAIEQGADSVIITDAEGIIEYVNDAFVRTTGFSLEEAVGKTPRILKSGHHDPELFTRLWSTVKDGQVFQATMINRRKNGAIYYDERVISPLQDDKGRITHFVASGRDITGRIEDQKRLQYLANHDVLTDLANRSLMQERLEHAINTSKRHRRSLGLLFLDLDDFKTINDTLGHQRGDDVLKIIADRITSVIRDGDTAGRMGGDEFMILVEEVAHTEALANLAERLLEAIRAPFWLDGRELAATGSIGIAVYPEDGQDTDTLVRKADIAMYRAKDLGAARFQFYSPEMGLPIAERMSLGQLLRGAIDRHELRLVYQPWFDLETESTVCLEALLRWNSSDLGEVAPERFIPLAESTGLIIPIGNWVLDSACRAAAEWNNHSEIPIPVAVNISSVQFEDPEFIQRIRSVLEEAGLSPEHLTLEITENVMLGDDSATRHVFSELRDLGVKVAIDDFGTGYSSMAYLRKFNVATIKIDRSFIANLEKSPNERSIVDALIQLAHSNGANVVAEGVETKSQLDTLRELGCDLAQGFHLSRPVRSADLGALIHRTTLPRTVVEGL